MLVPPVLLAYVKAANGGQAANWKICQHLVPKHPLSILTVR